jgi:ethanolamine utilization protein EutQ (cupin superfamily)
VKAIFNFLKMQTQSSDIVIGVMPMAERPFNTKINEDVFKLVLDKAISQSLSASAVIANDEDFC